GEAEQAVCLMDIPDDWDEQGNIELYIRTFEKAFCFLREFPETLWCWGNHDLSYPWLRYESGYSLIAARIVREEINEFCSRLPERRRLAYIHRIDDVLFMHGGLTERFVRKITNRVRFSKSHGDYIDAVVDAVNSLDSGLIWENDSPLWFRPQIVSEKMFMSDQILQVVGHTPVRNISKNGSVISCDVFSADSRGKPFGSREFLLLDTVTWEYRGIR
ncbi:MAG: metallophosphoesterase, partial [Mogibacterium sp.]|nr:metallophosphoesterase [Mogibacterium sp.]